MNLLFKVFDLMAALVAAGPVGAAVR